MSRISLKYNFLTALEIMYQRFNNSVSFFFLKVCFLARQKEKVESITIGGKREYLMSKRMEVKIHYYQKQLRRK